MSKKERNNFSGWVVVDKPKDMTSTRVVSVVRRLLNVKKAGHSGTLDPFATGLLPIAIGEATKTISFVMDGIKEYEFVMEFGKETDSLDIDGEVIKESDVIPEPEDVKNIITSFVGKIEQTPPKFSAIKINGKRAYDLARKGEEFEIKTREVNIFSLDFIEKIDKRSIKLKVKCSKGTYVRSLARDIAYKLGAICFVKELRRVVASPFSMQDAIKLEKLEELSYGDNPQQSLLSLETVLRDIAVLAVNEVEATGLKQGRRIRIREDLIFDKAKLEKFENICLAKFENTPIALIEIRGNVMHPYKVFNLPS